MIATDDLCSLIGASIVWADGEQPMDITPDTELLAIGLLDSLTIVRIVKEIEERIGTELPPTLLSAKNFRTPAHLERAVAGVLAG